MATEVKVRDAPVMTGKIRRGPLQNLRHEWDELMSQVLHEGENLLFRHVSPIDMAETDNAIEVRVDLPGVKPEEVDIQVSGNTLTISGERTEEREVKGRRIHRTERTMGTFTRTLLLPCAVNDQEAAAQFVDGVLTITLPKAEEARAHKIKVVR